MKLEGKVALVTGAGSGMGEAISRLFAKEGAKVVASDVNEENVNKLVTELKENGASALGIKCDVSNSKELKSMFDAAIKEYGNVDIIVNNAGIMDNFVPVADLEEELWDKVMNINLKAPYILSKLGIDYWLEKDMEGIILNIASVGGLFGGRGGSSYVASKHGLIGLTKNITSVYNDNKIRCNVIAPGAIATNIGATLTEPNMEGMQPIREKMGPSVSGTAEDIAASALFLVSDDAKFINGEVLVVDGGWTVV